MIFFSGIVFLIFSHAGLYHLGQKLQSCTRIEMNPYILMCIYEKAPKLVTASFQHIEQPLFNV